MRIESSAVNPAAHHSIGRQSPSSSNELTSPNGTSVEGDLGKVIPLGRSSSVSDTVADVEDLAILDELVEAINRNLNVVDKRLQFLVHEASGRVQLRVLERSTNEVIREVPPEQLLDLVGRIHDLIGLLVDETA